MKGDKNNWKDKIFLILPPRINRIRHVSLILSTFLAMVFVYTILVTLGADNVVSTLAIISGLFCLIAVLLIKIKIGRLHDINWSAWWVLAIFVPFFGWLFGVALFFIPGTKGANKFGPEPERASKFEYAVALFLLILIAASILIHLFMNLFFPVSTISTTKSP